MSKLTLKETKQWATQFVCPQMVKEDKAGSVQEAKRKLLSVMEVQKKNQPKNDNSFPSLWSLFKDTSCGLVQLTDKGCWFAV